MTVLSAIASIDVYLVALNIILIELIVKKRSPLSIVRRDRT